jgi:beta-fructofuranosidase
MVIASRDGKKGGLILLYRSTDLLNWEYQDVFLRGDAQQTEPFWQGTMWECPNWLDFGDRQALILSLQATPSDPVYAVYFGGRRRGTRFQRTQSGILVHGSSFYAPQVMKTPDGRYLTFGWLREGRTTQASLEAGWNGVLSIPLVVEMAGDASISLAPASELLQLRGKRHRLAGIDLAAGEVREMTALGGAALEIAISFAPLDEGQPPADADEVGLKVLCAPGGEEETTIVYRPAAGQIFVERERSSEDQRADINAATMPVALAPGEPLELRIFIDHSIIELFVNGRHCLAARVYPTRRDSTGLRLFANGSPAKVVLAEIWEIDAIWPQ